MTFSVINADLTHRYHPPVEAKLSFNWTLIAISNDMPPVGNLVYRGSPQSRRLEGSLHGVSKHRPSDYCGVNWVEQVSFPATLTSTFTA
jgi:hypothetical protein